MKSKKGPFKMKSSPYKAFPAILAAGAAKGAAGAAIWKAAATTAVTSLAKAGDTKPNIHGGINFPQRSGK